MKIYHIPKYLFSNQSCVPSPSWTTSITCLLCVLSFGFLNSSAKKDFQTVPIKSSINNVQPMTGIVLWEELDNKDTDAIQLDYNYK